MNRKVFVLIALALSVWLVTAACGGTAPAESVPTASPQVEATTAPAAEPTATIASTPTTAPPTATVAPTEPAPTPTVEPTASPEALYRDFPSVDCCRGRTLGAGRYAVPPWLGIPLTVDVGEGWRVLNEERAQLFLLGRGENAQNNPNQIIAFLNATVHSPAGSPESVLAGVAGAPELTVVAEPSSITIDGFEGLQMDSVALPNPDYKGSPADDIPPGVQFLPVIEQYFAPGFAWTTSSPEAQVRTIALQVGDQTLVFYMEAPQDEFEQFATDAETILQTLATIETAGN